MPQPTLRVDRYGYRLALHKDKQKVGGASNMIQYAYKTYYIYIMIYVFCRYTYN